MNLTNPMNTTNSIKPREHNSHVPLTADGRLYTYPTVGEEFKNYRAMCEALNIPAGLRGDSLIAQQTELRRFFTWDKTGQKIIITHIPDTPEPRIDFRGRAKDITPSQYLFNTILLYLIKYAPKDEVQYDYTSPNCVSFSQTDLKQTCFKLINKDYYSLRNVYKKKKEDLTDADLALINFDRKITSKVSQLINTGLERLQKESLLYMSKRYYIYYQDKMALDAGYDQIQQRPATDEEITMITDAGYETLEEIEGAIIPDNSSSFTSKDPKNSKNPVDPSKLYGVEKIKYINHERLKKLNESSYVAELRGEVWVNIVDKVQIFSVSDICLTRELTKREEILRGTLRGSTMPQAQLDLNTMMLTWVDEKAPYWTSPAVPQEAPKESELTSSIDMKKFADTFIDIKRTERCYGFKKIPCLVRSSFSQDANWISTPLLIHYASNQLAFNLENLSSGIIGPRDVYMVCLDMSSMMDTSERITEKTTDSSVAIGAGFRIATNDPHVISIIINYSKDYELFPIEGFLGGFTNVPSDKNNEDKNEDKGNMNKSINKSINKSTNSCLIFKLHYEDYNRLCNIIKKDVFNSLDF